MTTVTVSTGTRERRATLVADNGETATIVFDGAQHVCTYPSAAIVADEIDAPSDWDSGVVNFDPYI